MLFYLHPSAELLIAPIFHRVFRLDPFSYFFVCIFVDTPFRKNYQKPWIGYLVFGLGVACRTAYTLFVLLGSFLIYLVRRLDLRIHAMMTLANQLRW